MDPIPWVAGTIQTILYSDFFWIYYTKYVLPSHTAGVTTDTFFNRYFYVFPLKSMLTHTLPVGSYKARNSISPCKTEQSGRNNERKEGDFGVKVSSARSLPASISSYLFSSKFNSIQFNSNPIFKKTSSKTPTQSIPLSNPPSPSFLDQNQNKINYQLRQQLTSLIPISCEKLSKRYI